MGVLRASNRSTIPLISSCLAALACAGLWNACSLNPQPTPPEQRPAAGPGTAQSGGSSEGASGGVPVDVDGGGVQDGAGTTGGGPVAEPEAPGAASGGSGSTTVDPADAAGAAGASGEGGAPGIVH